MARASRLPIETALAAALAALGGTPDSARGEPQRGETIAAPHAPRAAPAPLAPSTPDAPTAAEIPDAPPTPRAPGADGTLALSLSRDFEVFAGADGSAGLRISAQGEVLVEGSGYRVWLARTGAGDLDRLGSALFIDFDRDGALDAERERVDADGLARFGDLELRVELTR
jgi:hypothetical protein